MEKVINTNVIEYSERQQEKIKSLSRRMILMSNVAKLNRFLLKVIFIFFILYCVHHQLVYGHILHIH